jgi:hypothetical protein
MLIDQFNLARSDGGFQSLVQAALVHNAIQIANEVAADVQTITMGTVTSGTFTLTFLGQTTAALQWNSSALAIQTALQNLTTIGAGNVECTGGPLPGTGVVINFTGTMVGAFPLITHTDTLTGGVATITHTTVGVWAANHTKRAALAKLVLANPIGYVQVMAIGVADGATIQTDFPAPAPYVRSGSVTAAQADIDINNQVAAIWNAYT